MLSLTKLKLGKNTKVILASVCVLVIGIISFILYNEINHPGTEEISESLYSYNNKGDINYEVFLKPNIIYEDPSLAEDKTYIKPLVDYIKTTFSYEFKGERPAVIKGNYNVIAMLEGYNRVEEKTSTVWKKEFVIVPPRYFENNDKKMYLAEEVPLELEKYDGFVEQVLKDVKINTPVNLSLFMNIDMTAETDKGLIEEKLSPAISIPLSTNLFEITKTVTGEEPKAIEETKKVQLPVNKNMVTTYSIIVGIVVILLLYLIFFTNIEKDQIILELNKIFKKHGSRLVALNTEIAAKGEVHEVKSIDDLIRVSDEIEKPVMYRYNKNVRDINRFYVFDDNFVYIFKVKENLYGLRPEKPLKEKVINWDKTFSSDKTEKVQITENQ